MENVFTPSNRIFTRICSLILWDSIPQNGTFLTKNQNRDFKNPTYRPHQKAALTS